MTEQKITNSKKKDLLNRHRGSNLGSVHDVYERPSVAKVEAWENILYEHEELDSVTYPKVNSFNVFSYSVSFEYMKENKKRLRYYTSSNTYDFEI